MKIGVSTFVTDEGIGPIDLGRALEERGFESLFVAEHTHIPVKRETPYIPNREMYWPAYGELPRIYYRTIDPFVTLTAVAAVTRRLLLATGVALVVEREPINLAKQFASLDLLSGGRVLAGVGAGWNREEMRNLGTDPTTRMALVRERVLAMKEIWSKESSEFHGKFVDFDPIRSWPKPVQRPHPPVLVGGDGPGVLDRVLEYGDGWAPILAKSVPVLAGRITELQDRAAAAGRGRLPVTVYGVPPDAEVIGELEAAGADRALLQLPTTPRDESLAELDRFVPLLEKYGD
ncbi:LLM class F420-dependent oxidoreductase [Amycolatopsis coloradensis]|uniref:LLM class F420-dependent oxidoreductase n=1 Tax=Amycolatopsis coloradensis TaxID=76021 RepID=A0A1R0L0U9_9PSEU|nr:LLM class F420-dependent oxidoreductase [Amycolatopsis coloradensis]OLZ55344.1 LLM class F420-dependent oxidoreductase [Amycolatopsis coloradensis]